MKKQNNNDESYDLMPISERDLERIEKIWKISIKELPDDALIELEDYPEVIKKTKASLKVLLDGRRRSNNKNQISSNDLAGPVLEIFKYMILEIQMSRIKSAEGCKNMYI